MSSNRLGKPKPHSTKEIRQRREKVLILMAKGFNQSDIAAELNTTRHTIMRDLKEINQWTKKGLYDLAKQTLPTMYHSCIIGMNEAEKEAWKIYHNTENDTSINNWHKISALRLLIDINKSKFRMFQDGPAFMEINRLQSELERIKKDVSKDNNFKPFVKPTNYEESMRPRELQNLKLSNLHEKQINRQELERLGVPYEIVRDEEKGNQREDLKDLGFPDRSRVDVNDALDESESE